jgi:hypothetical protein
MENKDLRLPISIGILSWGSPMTLRNTLDSYRKSGLFDISDDIILFAQESTRKDREIAQEYGVNYMLESPENIGIGAAFKELVVSSKYENVMLLENDWVAVENFQVISNQLSQGLKLLDQYGINVVKYRSRYDYGDPLYTLTYRGREMDSPEHLLECVHWRQNPDLDFPNNIKKISLLDDWYVASSKNCCQTNNPTLFKKDFYLENIAPWDRGGISLEGSIKHFWESSDFKIAHSRGIFKHFRIDR